MSWLRTLSIAAVLSTPVLALAQGAPERASALNDEGKKLFADKRYEEAYARFSEAARLAPEGRYFFNACFALNSLERYPEAIKACEQVEPAGADEKLIDKTQKALASLRQKVAARGGGETPGRGSPPSGGGAAAGGAPAGGTAASDDPFVQKAAGNPADDYKWSVGAEAGGAANLGVGQKDGLEAFSTAGPSVRLFADFLVNERPRLGLQAYVGITNFGAGADNASGDQLNLADLGLAVFIQQRLFGHLYCSPLIGAHISIQQPDTLSEGFVAAGGRAEFALSYVFGPASEHAISVTPGLTVYGPASGTVGSAVPADFNLDQPSATFSIGLGYQFRFATPFGATPLITLE